MTMEETRSKEARRALPAGAWRRQPAVNRCQLKTEPPIVLEDLFEFAENRLAALVSLQMIW